jgi:glycosyltransferase involved in cell wall biosynthesis
VERSELSKRENERRSVIIMLLSIPTYNRVHDLLYNLQLLEKMIIKKNLEEKISIIVSDNNSSDSTGEMLKEYSKTSKLHIFS